jgi:hypothetical protein
LDRCQTTSNAESGIDRCSRGGCGRPRPRQSDDQALIAARGIDSSLFAASSLIAHDTVAAAGAAAGWK